MSAVPSGWKVERLKDVARVNANALPAGTDADYEFDYLEISNVNYNGVVSTDAIEHLRFEDAPSRARRRVASGSTVISSVRPNLQAVAFFASAPKHLICSTGFNVVEPQSNKLAPQFTYYHLLSENARQYFEAAATGVGYPAIGDKDFNAFTVTLPPLPEQQRISTYLDASCAAIDAAVSAKRRQLDTLDALKSSILLKALTLGLNPNIETRATGATVLPIVPVGWGFRRLKSVAAVRYGLGQPPVELSSGVGMIRATDVDAGTIRRGNFLRVDPDDLPLGRNPYLKAGEIIVVRSGAYTGDSAIVPSDLDGMVAGYDMVVTATRTSPRFLAYCLLSRYVLEGQIYLLTLRAAQPHLNAEELGGIQLALPPTLDEQEAIADFVDVKFGELNRLRATITAQIDTLIAYRKSLIHECVTGQRRVTEADVAAIA